MGLMLSPEELKRVVLELQQLFPDRQILQAYDSNSACNLWLGSPSQVGKNRWNGKPVDLETEIEVFHSIFNWKCGAEDHTVEKYRPDTYQIWVEKKSKKELDEIVKAFAQVGIRGDLNIHFPKYCGLVPENKRKEYWASESIYHPDVHVSEVQAFRREGMKPGIELLLHPGFYPEGNGKLDLNASLANGVLLITEMNPMYREGRYNNCRICRGENYQNMEMVRFLVGGRDMIPLACEFCVDEYLAQVSKAFKH